ncbi:hypothetical protein KC19_2G163600, partial [Ceratodon purpureus]
MSSQYMASSSQFPARSLQAEDMGPGLENSRVRDEAQYQELDGEFECDKFNDLPTSVQCSQYAVNHRYGSILEGPS